MARARGQFGQCKLCGETGKVYNSHVIPEFCYKSIYQGKHQLIEVRVSQKGFREAVSQKGYKELMLCSSCEQKLNAWEKPFHDFWCLKVIPSGPILEECPVVRGFDYQWMKLFHLSVILRLHSAIGFGRIDLGPYAKRIQTMLLDGEPGGEECFPVFGRLLLDDNKNIMEKIITEPDVDRWDGYHCYAVCYAGCEWIFLITETPSRKQLDAIKTFGLHQGGTMMLPTTHYRRSASWRKLVGEIGRAMKGKHV